jgi:tetratricopeptide (TPR) repeat protein
MTRTILLLAAVLLCNAVFSASPDSVFFNTEFEKKTFELYEKSKPLDSADLFMALDYRPEVSSSKIHEFADELKPKIEKLPVAKKLKVIFNSVHDRFLVKYKDEAFFNDIFITGDYNCVTASALYALILHDLGINFIIKETPDHIYLIADPGSLRFIMETTLPSKGVIEFDTKVKSNFIQYLHNNKIISEEDIKNLSTDELFDKFYLKDKNITLRELAGIHYYNRGAMLFNKEFYAGSISYFQKAVFFNKDQKIKYMLNTALLNQLVVDLQKKNFDGYLLALYVNANDSNDTGLQYASQYFNVVSSEIIVNKADPNQYRRYFERFSSTLRTKNNAEFNRLYYFFLGYYFNVNYEYPEAIAALAKAYQVNPQNIATRELLTQSITKCYLNDRNHLQAIDSLSKVLEQFPYLINDKNIVGYTEYCYAKTIEQLLLDEKLEESSALIKKLERFLYKYNDFAPNADNLVLVYQQAGLYYVYADKLDDAEQLVRRGLRRVPDSEILKALLLNIRSMKHGSYEFPELMSDSSPLKRYLLALAKAKDNADLINENKPALYRTWQTSDPPEMKMGFSLKEGKEADFSNETGIKPVEWKFDSTKCILSLMTGPGKNSVNIIITELLPDRMKGVLYRNENYSESSEIILIPLK